MSQTITILQGSMAASVDPVRVRMAPAQSTGEHIVGLKMPCGTARGGQRANDVGALDGRDACSALLVAGGPYQVEVVGDLRRQVQASRRWLAVGAQTVPLVGRFTKAERSGVSVAEG